MSTVDLGTRIKGYEKEGEKRIPYDEYIIVRIDGHKFSKFTKGFKKPYDKILSVSMENTTKDLVEEFGAVTGYTQSDEITLIFPPQYKTKWIPLESFQQVGEDTIWEDKETKEWGYVEIYEEGDREEYRCTYYIGEDDSVEDHVIYGAMGHNREYNGDKTKILDKYNFYEEDVSNNQILGGRTQKLASLIASYTSIRFNKHLEEQIKIQNADTAAYYDNSFRETSEESEWRKQMGIYRSKVGNAWFDARVFGVPSADEAFNAIMWRVRDAEKNSRSMFAQAYCSHKSLLNKNGVEQVEYCKATTGNDWETVEDKLKYGILVKKESYYKVLTDLDKIQTFGDVDSVKRTRLVTWAEPLTSYSDESVEMITRKLKNEIAETM